MAESTGKLDKLQGQVDSVLVEKLGKYFTNLPRLWRLDTCDNSKNMFAEYEKNIKVSEHKYAVLMERCLADANEKEKLHEAMSELKRKL